MAELRNRRSCGIAVCVLVIEISLGQINPVTRAGAGPQAATRQELDRVGEIHDAQDSAATIDAAERFIKDYPNSEFLEYAHAARMDAHLSAGNERLAEGAARAALARNPANVHVLITLADIYSREKGNTDSARNKRFLAFQHVREALGILDGLSMPQNARDGAWLAAKKELVAHGQSVLGYVLLRKRKTQEAVPHLEQAAELDPQGIYFYRCGLAYMLQNRQREAAEAFEKARKFGPATVSRASEIRLNNLSLVSDR